MTHEEPEMICSVIDLYPGVRLLPCLGCGSPTPHVRCKVRMLDGGELTLLGICQICGAPEGYGSPSKQD